MNRTAKHRSAPGATDVAANAGASARSGGLVAERAFQGWAYAALLIATLGLGADAAYAAPNEAADAPAPEAVEEAPAPAESADACDVRSRPELQRALELELEGRVDDLEVVAVPCESPHFYRVRLGERTVILSRADRPEDEARFLALSVAHLVRESEPAPAVPEPWVDRRPVATERDVARWWPASQVFEPTPRPLTEGELRVGGMVGPNGRAGSGWLSVRARFRRVTLGVEGEGFLGSRGSDDFRTLSARAFFGVDLRYFGLELEGGILTPRSVPDVNYAPALGLRVRVGVAGATAFHAAVQFARVDGSINWSEVRAGVLVAVSVPWRLEAGGVHARETGVFAVYVGTFRWLRGTGGPRSLALGARLGGTLLDRRSSCGGPCGSDPTETTELRTFGGFHGAVTLRRHF
ncbi:MAG: hypothetical protein AAF411_02735 [Myxococcota bacterium]